MVHVMNILRCVFCMSALDFHLAVKWFGAHNVRGTIAVIPGVSFDTMAHSLMSQFTTDALYCLMLINNRTHATICMASTELWHLCGSMDDCRMNLTCHRKRNNCVHWNGTRKVTLFQTNAVQLEDKVRPINQTGTKCNKARFKWWNVKTIEWKAI